MTGDSIESNGSESAYLIVRVGNVLCALPAAHAVETMRPMPVEAVAGAPPFVRGVSIIRGAPVPVVDLQLLFEGADHPCTRLVTVRVGDRRVALAVDSVIGLRVFGDSVAGDMPPLLGRAQADVVETIGTLDGHLLRVMNAGRWVPPQVWEAVP